MAPNHVKNRPVSFSFKDGENYDDLFEIDEDTGTITFAQTPPKEMIDKYGGTFFSLDIIVADKEYPKLYDVANVSFQWSCLAKFTISAEGTATPWTFLAAADNFFGHTNWGLQLLDYFNKTTQEAQLLDHFWLYGAEERIWGYFPEQGHTPYELYEGVQGCFDTEKSFFADSHSVYIWDKSVIMNVVEFTKNIQENPETYKLFTNNCTTVAIAAANKAGMDLNLIPETFFPSLLIHQINLHEQTCDACW